jgi:dolichol-phosphate mannosyltransferase
VRALVALPTYNELENVTPLVEQVLGLSDEFDVLVVDDGSPDGTGLVAEHLKSVYPGRVEVIHRQGKLGLATAYLAGFRYGLVKGYDYVFEMDADFSHDPAYLPQFIETARATGADVVLGSRYAPGGGVENWTWSRRVISRGGSLYAGRMLQLPYRDLTGGFKLFRREALERLDLDMIKSTGYGFQIEVTYRLHQVGAKIVEHPIVFRDRRAGQSKMSPGIFLEALVMVAGLRVQPNPSAAVEPTRERAGS